MSNWKRSITITALIAGACLESAPFAQSNCKEVKGSFLTCLPRWRIFWNDY